MKVSFIGIGVMGRGMVRNLLKAGVEVHVYTRTPSSAQEIVQEGAIWHDRLGDCAGASPIVITMVGFPQDVEEVYFGAQGILATAQEGAIVVDMTTTSPKLAEKIYAEAAKKRLQALDAPVSGGDLGAKNGTLTIMVGGEREAFEHCLPVFQMMGKNIVYTGAAGCGQHTKMANQIAIAGTVSGVCEAVAYAKTTGLDAKQTLDIISSGAAGSWQMSNNGYKMVQKDDAPGFYIKHFMKDMGLAAEEAQERGLQLPILSRVIELYQSLLDAGHGDLGTQAIYKLYEEGQGEAWL